jgi:hypothetical protein
MTLECSRKQLSENEDIAMNEREMDKIASKIVAKLMEPENRNALADSIAHALRECATQYGRASASIGERLDTTYP